MRVTVVLALILGIITPPVAWTPPPDGVSTAGATALASPLSSACVLVRGSAKAEKTFAGDWLAVFDRRPQHPATEHALLDIAWTTHASHVDFDNPPLAPRPPPSGS